MYLCSWQEARLRQGYGSGARPGYSSARGARPGYYIEETPADDTSNGVKNRDRGSG